MIKLKPSKYTEVCGWYGMSAILLAYILVSFDAIASNSLAFQLLNLTGGLGIIIVSLSKGVAQSVILNIFWSLVALIAITRILF